MVKNSSSWKFLNCAAKFRKFDILSKKALTYEFVRFYRNQNQLIFPKQICESKP
jgi:hypothetical protein